MPLISVKLTPPADLTAKQIERLRKKIQPVAMKCIDETVTAIRKTMLTVGKKPTYPIQWDSEKQRRAFFATDGFGKGIPTKRTGQYTKSWKVIKVQDGREVGSPLAHARFIGGTARNARAQSNIHRGRWNLFKTATNKMLAKLPHKVRESFQALLRQEGFRAK